MTPDLERQLAAYRRSLDDAAPPVSADEAATLIASSKRRDVRVLAPRQGVVVAAATALVVLALVGSILLWRPFGETQPVVTVPPSLTITTIDEATLQGAGICGAAAGSPAQLQPGAEIPAWRAELVDGGTFNLADHCGQQIVVLFFADWCDICGNQTFAPFQKAYDVLQPDTVFVAVDTLGPDAEAARQTIAAGGYSFPVVIDADNAIADAWGVEAIPLWVVIDIEGQVESVLNGLDEGLPVVYHLAGIDTDTGGIEGVESEFGTLSTQHTGGAVAYDQTPPVGGAHADQWQNCGFYTEPIRSENAMHSLEHGAVWITHGPDLSTEELDALRVLALSSSHVLVSPYTDLPERVVASAWSRQLVLDSALDPRLTQFVEFFAAGPQSPEIGATCSGGIGTPER